MLFSDATHANTRKLKWKLYNFYYLILFKNEQHYMLIWDHLAIKFLASFQNSFLISYLKLDFSFVLKKIKFTQLKWCINNCSIIKKFRFINHGNSSPAEPTWTSLSSSIKNLGAFALIKCRTIHTRFANDDVEIEPDNWQWLNGEANLYSFHF